jgi:hypothetical protein
MQQLEEPMLHLLVKRNEVKYTKLLVVTYEVRPMLL